MPPSIGRDPARRPQQPALEDPDAVPHEGERQRRHPERRRQEAVDRESRPRTRTPHRPRRPRSYPTAMVATSRRSGAAPKTRRSGTAPSGARRARRSRRKYRSHRMALARTDTVIPFGRPSWGGHRSAFTNTSLSRSTTGSTKMSGSSSPRLRSIFTTRPTGEVGRVGRAVDAGGEDELAHLDVGARVPEERRAAAACRRTAPASPPAHGSSRYARRRRGRDCRSA